MPRKKIDASQSNFGFPDENLHHSHDEMVLWIKDNAENIAKQVLNWNESWNPNLVQDIKNNISEVLSKRACSSQTHKNIECKSALSAFYSLIDAAPSLEEERGNDKASDRQLIAILQGIGEPPSREIEVKSEIERPIVKYNGTKPTIVGYVDIVISARATKLSLDGSTDMPRWHTHWSDRMAFSLDAKTEIRSLGELLRQFKSYQVYWPGMPFFIVSADTRFAEAICDEGFGFVKYPKIEIMMPKPKTDW